MPNKDSKSNLIRPEDIKRKTQEENHPVVVQEEVIPTPEQLDDYTPPSNVGGTVRIMFESAGRFGNPPSLYLEDLKGRHINDIVTSKDDRLLETLVVCLNECVIEPKGFDIGNLTTDEFFELMIGMKTAFDSFELKYRWFHKCQDNVPDSEKKMSETSIDLRNLNSVSIEESDEKLREFAKEKFEKMSSTEFKQYLMAKYNDSAISYSKEQELSNIKVKEPVMIRGYKDSYEFSFMRVKYLIEAHRRASKEIDNLIRIENNKAIYKKSKEEASAMRQTAIEELNREKGRKFINYAQALCLVSKVDDKGNRTFFTSSEERINESKNISRQVSLNYMKALETVVYGIHHEVELECPLCESEEKERGLLQRFITPYHLLPVSVVEGVTTKRGSKQSSGFDFYF